MICRQELCRDARLVRPRKVNNKQTARFLERLRKAMASKPRGYWSECTQHFERTHGPCVPTCA